MTIFNETASNSVAFSQVAALVPFLYSSEVNTDTLQLYEDFSSTVMATLAASAIGSGATNKAAAVSTDGTNLIAYLQEGTPTTDKIYELDGFTSTITDSFSTDTQTSGGVPRGVSWLTDVYFSEVVLDKIWQTTGFSSTISSSLSLGGIDTNVYDVSKSSSFTYFSGSTGNKIFKLVGFTTTLSDSIAGSGTSAPRGISAELTRHLTSNDQSDKYHERSGFTTTVLDSFASGVSPSGLEVQSLAARAASTHNESVSHSITFQQQADPFFHGLEEWLVWGDLNNTRVFRTPADFSNLALDLIGGPATLIPQVNLRGVSWDGTDLYTSDAEDSDLYHYDGFSNTVLETFDVASVDTDVQGSVIDVNGDVQFSGNQAGKLYKTSGFTSTIADSLTAGVLPLLYDVSADFTPDTYGTALAKAYHLDGFSTTINDSFAHGGGAVEFKGFTFDGDADFFGSTREAGDTVNDKLFEFTGFSSTVANSLSVNAIPGNIIDPQGLDHSLRLDFTVTDVVAANTVAFGVNAIGLKLPVDVDNAVAFAVAGVGVVPRAEHNILFTQEATSNIKNGDAENTINMTAIVVDLTPPVFFMENEVGFDVEADAAGSVYTRSIEHELDFDDFSAPVTEETASNTLGFTQEVFQEFCADSEIAFTNTAVGLIAEPTVSEITFDDEVDISGSIWTRDPESDLAFTQVAGAWIGNQIGYDPVLFDNDSACLTPPTSVTLSEDRFVELSYLGTSVQFRNPELGNIDVINTRVVNHRTRGNKLVQYRSCQWPTDQTARMSFKHIAGAKKQEIENFLRLTLGQLVQFKDNDGRIWHGIITNPETVFALERVGSEHWTFSLELDIEGGPRTITENIRQVITLDNTAFEFTNLVESSISFTQSAGRIHEEAAASPFGVSDVAAGEVPAGGFRDFAVQAVTASAGFRDSVPNLTKSNVWTVGFWHNPSNLSGRHELSGYHQGNTIGWAIETNGVNLRTITQGGIGLATTLALTVGNWFFVVLSNGPTHGHRVYLGPKGGSLSNQSTTQQVPTFGGAWFTLQAINNFTVAGAVGSMAEAFYEPTELGVADITAMFNSGDGIQHSELAGLGIAPEAYWGMQDASGGVVDEENSNDLVEYTSGGSRTYQVAGPGV